MFIFTPTAVSIDQFILFWSTQYHDEIEASHYTDIIQLRPFTVEQMQKLFRWKGGARLRDKTVTLVEKKYLPHIEKINALPLDYPASQFLEDFTGTGAIWGIFLLHCWQPNEYPIYDQNVHRAMTYISKQKCEEIESWGDKRKKAAYFDRYRSFFEPYRDQGGYQQADRALFQFGKFLKSSTFPDIVEWRSAKLM